MQWCEARKRLSSCFWLERVALYIDCKKFSLPLSEKPRRSAARKRVRGACRTRAEGLRRHLTKPSQKKHRYHPGATAWVLGGVCGNRIRLWEYIPGRWNGATAAAMYSGPIKQLLLKARPLTSSRKRWHIVEDGDPAGFKSAAAMAAKKAARMETIDLPPYSPDLQPLDFSLWTQVEQKARAAIGNKVVSSAEYRRVLRRSALRLSPQIVARAVSAMRPRILAICAAKGGHIQGD